MCNLYTERLSAAEVAAQFCVENPIQSHAGGEVYPGTPGMVVREKEGSRVMQSMTWGFPLRLKGVSPSAKPKPVNNIADLNKPMWKGLAAKPRWRCLIPITAFAEAEGPKGAETRTWFNVKDQPIFCLGRSLADQRRVGAGLSRRHDRLQRSDPPRPWQDAGACPR